MANRDRLRANHVQSIGPTTGTSGAEATDMHRFVFLALSLPLVACYDGEGERFSTGECPAGETCSDTTPNGLEFIGNHFYDALFETGPHPTAIGGTQVIALQGTGLTTDYLVDDDGGLGVEYAGRNGLDVTVKGVASRSNYLRILDADGWLMDRKELTGAALDRIALFPGLWESIPADREVAYFAGERTIGVALYGDVQHEEGPVSERIVDASMQVEIEGAERVAWDAVTAPLTTGTHSATVTAGDKPAATLDITVVDHADSLAVQPDQPTTVVPDESQLVCFEALAGGRYIAQASWTFAIDGELTVGTLVPNCVGVLTSKTSGTVTVQASAAGATTQIDLTVVAPLRRAPAQLPSLRTSPAAIATAGDRAAM